MTKSEIKDSLIILKDYCRGKAKQQARMSENVMDFCHGRSEAYSDIYERLENIMRTI